MEELIKFKHLLEYFVAHLNFVQNNDDSSAAGYNEYIKPWKDKKSFKYSGQGYGGDGIQNQVEKWEAYKNGKMCINVNPSFGNYATKSTYINWATTGINIIAKWKDNKVVGLMLTNYSDEEGFSSWSKPEYYFTLNALGLYNGNEDINENLTEFFNEFNKRKTELDMERKYSEYIRLLKSNHNLILTGAPGTGKTYMAKRIAESIGAEWQMVQFHPSYDYTDFVEGLRPNDKGTFERTDGVFKKFCANALKNWKESEPETKAKKRDKAIQKAVDELADKYADTQLHLEKTKNQFQIIGNDEKRIHISIPNNGVVKEMKIKKSELVALFQKQDEIVINNVKDVRTALQRKYGTQDDSYLLVLYKLLKQEPIIETDGLVIPRKDFVFIIDEINRGELSKIFGELFFSIDPRYRGTDGKVLTQYQNLIDDDDDFSDGFFVPENVYIIGTMNDIDRSVESMDFAVRRRFAWKEVTAAETIDDILKDIPNAENARKAMIAINEKIAAIDGLGTAYQIGAAYFKNVEKYNGDLQKLWDYHIKGLLYEYFRGERKEDIYRKLKELKEAYDGNVTTDNDNGQ